MISYEAFDFTFVPRINIIIHTRQNLQNYIQVKFSDLAIQYNTIQYNTICFISLSPYTWHHEVDLADAYTRFDPSCFFVCLSVCFLFELRFKGTILPFSKLSVMSRHCHMLQFTRGPRQAANPLRHDMGWEVTRPL